MKNIHYFISLLFCFFTSLAHAQDRRVVDSLQQLYNSAHQDTSKVLLLAEMAYEFRTIKPDTALLLGKESYNLAKKVRFERGLAWAAARMGAAWQRKNNLDSALEKYEEARQIFDQISYENSGKGAAYNGIASISYSRGDCASALENFEKALFFRNQTGEKMGISISINGLGNSYYGLGNYPLALSYYQESLKIKEEIKDQVGIGIALNNIAQIYYQQKQYDTALVYLQKSMLIKEKMQDKYGLTYSFNNIAGVYYEQKKYDLALQYHQKALALKEELDDKQGIATSLNNLAQVYMGQKKYQKAIVYYTKALEIEKKIKDKRGLIYSLNGLAKIYNEINQHDLANQKALEALATAKEIAALSEIKDIYETLYHNAKKQGNIAQALHYFELHKQASDSLFSSEKMKVLNNLNSSYELNKKQQHIALLQRDKALKDTELKLKEEEAKEQRIYFISLLGAFLSLLFLAFVLYRNNKQKQEVNKLLQSSNQEINAQKAEIQETNEELKQINEEFKITLDVLAKQKAEIERKNENITSSINYARRIQNAVLPLKEYMQNSFGENNFFVLYQPRDIVSGDFYWLHDTENHYQLGNSQAHTGLENPLTSQVIFAVADCTGHGIPGAFMSMIGNELLNQIVTTNKITSPDLILQDLHKGVRYALQQKVTESQDGMDISIVTITKRQAKNGAEKPQFETLAYAGAMNALYFFEPKNTNLIEIKATKNSVGGGIHAQNKDFVLHTVDLFEPETNTFKEIVCYLFTDGFQDQFGGEKSKKFMSRNFKDLLQNIHQKAMPTQQTLLETTLHDWIKIAEEHQTDDITVVGLRLNAAS
jgi:tetratricopeptide (TPR) repeat protein